MSFTTIVPMPRAARVVLPAVCGLAVMAWGAWQMPSGALGQAVGGLSAIAPWRWVGALALTALSFVALGRMEGLWHRNLRLGTQDHAARRTGRVAVAVGQMLGATSVVAALLRWRLLQGVAGPAAVSRLSVAASLSFMLCWALAALVALWWVALDALPALSATTLLLAVPLAAAALWRYGPMLRRNASLVTGVMSYTGLDLLCAGGAFVLLIPSDVPMADTLAVFILALGAGLVSHAPLGLGAFDLVVFALLPIPAAAIFPGLLAYRLVYGLVPGLVGLAAISQTQPLPGRATLRHLLHTRAPAIWALSSQGASIWQKGSGAALVGHPPLVRVVIGPTLGPLPAPLDRTAHYKCDARTAASLRARGWRVVHVASEAWLDPRNWSSAAPVCAGLRRKLRQAEAAGIRIARLDDSLPLPAMAAIARDWSMAHGGELGFSMSRFSPAALQDQAVFGIYQGDDLRGFVSFQTGPQDWCLDLIRHGAKLPSGAIPAAIVAAIAAAGACGVPTLSLAAVPTQTGPLAWVGRNRAGLTQFKRSFAPHWRPLYHAAPHAAALIFTLASVTWAVQRPLARLFERAWQLSFPATHATEGATVRTGHTPVSEVAHDTSFRQTSRRARLDPRRWRNWHEPVQHGSIVRRRAGNVERRPS